jgi:hypothetical protein
MASKPPVLDDEDRALLERVATRIVDLHLEVAAVLTIEGCRPLSLLAGQTMVFFEPIVGALLRLPDYRRFAALIERREALDVLLHEIERRADDAHDARKAARRAAAADRTHGDKSRRP